MSGTQAGLPEPGAAVEVVPALDGSGALAAGAAGVDGAAETEAVAAGAGADTAGAGDVDAAGALASFAVGLAVVAVVFTPEVLVAAAVVLGFTATGAAELFDVTGGFAVVAGAGAGATAAAATTLGSLSALIRDPKVGPPGVALSLSACLSMSAVRSVPPDLARRASNALP